MKKINPTVEWKETSYADITFELKKIDGHWYIVIINGVETDCSA